ncbi:MAG: hypothetical protein ACM3U2_20795, partial [Deltaproteobacteria bacterium]
MYTATMDQQQAVDAIRASPLAEVAELLVAELLASARLVVDDGAAGAMPATTSHFGGLPSLPRAVDWPHWDPGSYLR